MSDRMEELARRLVIGHKSDGRSVYDEQAKADPVTGQAAWFDLRVRIEKAAAPEGEVSQPQFAPLPGPAADNSPLRYGAKFRSAK